MSTRSLIGRQNADGTVAFIYCHFDGYLSGVGETLHTNYRNTDKVDALMALGDISSLGEEIGEAHNFDDRYSDQDPRARWCNVYSRDRGEDGCEAKTTDRAGFFTGKRQMGAEYQYLWTGDDWLVRSYDEPARMLDEAIAAGEVEAE